MQIYLTSEEVELLLESLKYSKQRVSDAQGTPYELRKEKLEKLDSIATKVRTAQKG